jgi:O-antigen ligase
MPAVQEPRGAGVKFAFWPAAFALVWGYAVFEWGGVVTLDRKVFLLALGVTGLAWWAVNRRDAAAIPGAARWCWWLLPAYAAVEVIPVPRGIIAVLSPGRAELERALDGVAAGGRTATLSVLPAAAMDGFLLLAGYAVVFYLGYQLAAGHPERRWTLMLPVVVAAVLEAVLGMAQAVGGGTAAGTYVNRDHYAGLLEMALPFALAYPVARWRGVDTRREFRVRLAAVMCAGWGAAAVLVIGSLTSLSRTGFVAPLFAAMIMGVVAWRGNGWRSAGLAAVLAGGLAACFVFLPSDALIARFADSRDDLTAKGRTLLWRESLALVKRFPVFGCGLGGYESAFLRYKVSVPMVSDDHAHNDYLQFLIELGAVGFAMGAVLVGSVVRRAWRAAARGANAENRYLGIACIGAFAAIGLHSLVDFNLYIPANAMLLAWISGVAVAIEPRRSGVRDLRKLGLGVTVDLGSA